MSLCSYLSDQVTRSALRTWRRMLLLCAHKDHWYKRSHLRKDIQSKDRDSAPRICMQVAVTNTPSLTHRQQYCLYLLMQLAQRPSTALSARGQGAELSPR